MSSIENDSKKGVVIELAATTTVVESFVDEIIRKWFIFRLNDEL